MSYRVLAGYGGKRGYRMFTVYLTLLREWVWCAVDEDLFGTQTLNKGEERLIWNIKAGK